MKCLYLECNMGVAGDMLMGALLDTIEDKDAWIEQMNHLNLPGVHLSYRTDEKCGITGTHITVTVHGVEEGQPHHELPHEHHHEQTHEHHHEQTHEHHHEHAHEHHEHSHTSLADIKQIVSQLHLSESVKKNAMAVYGLIAEAESAAHGKPVEQIHFHEVGTMDALADVIGCCLLIEQIAPDKIVVSPVRTGFGQVHCAHGILPVPAPAAAWILNGVPTMAGNIEGELCTPTGAALVRHFADEFSYQPEMTVTSIGYGTGVKDFPVANCVRAMIGTLAGKQVDETTEKMRDTILELSCNIDDMTGEELGYAKEQLMEGKAVDVYTIPIGMKKNRPGTMLSVLCKPEDRAEVVQDIFRYTTTIGIRMYECPRFILNRTQEERYTELGKLRVKISHGYGVKREKAEHEDLRKMIENNEISDGKN